MSTKTKRRGPGRPKLYAGGFIVRFTEQQLEFLEREAEERAVPFAFIVREALQEKMRRERRRQK